MKQRAVILSPEATDDLIALYDWIAKAASPTIAMVYLQRVEQFCGRLATGSERGQARGDSRPGLRIIGFERRLTIAFVVASDYVTILRIFSGGRDWASLL